MKFMLMLLAVFVATVVAFPSQQNEGFARDMNVIRREPVDNVDVFQHVSRFVECGASKIYENTPGMAEWCREQCFHDPPFCPPAQCRCW